jgi:hypothetical protein
MSYEIRVVFQSAEAYQSAVEGLYKAFGVDLGYGTAIPSRNGTSPDDWDHTLSAGAVTLERYLSEDPPLVAKDGYSFTVEDQTRW